MLRKINLMVIFTLMVSLPSYAAGKAESLEEGIEQLAIDISNQMKAKGVKKIAIDDFTDLNGYKSALGDFISEELVTNFYTQGAGSFEVVERRELARVLKEQKLGGSGLLNKKTIAKVGEVLGIDAIVTGSIAYLGRSIKVNARMLGVNDARVFAATSQKMPKDETVEALLSQSGRLDQPLSNGAVSSPGVQIQSFSTAFQNSFLSAKPINASLSKNKKGVIISVGFKNTGDKVQYLGINHSGGGVTVAGNKGSIAVRCKTSGFNDLYEQDYSKKSKHTLLERGATTIGIFQCNTGEEIDDNLFTLSASMIKYSGKDKEYVMFNLSIPNIQVN